MFFSEQERKIYVAPNSEKKHDPLHLDRLLTIHSGNRLNELITLRNAISDNLGDVSVEGKRQAAIESAKAELELARIARKTFGLPEFPECLDAEALETLYHFLEWLEGKGETARKPQSSPESSLEPSTLTTTMSS
jgi:hypothetical protein